MKKSLLIAAFGLVSVGAGAQTLEEKPIENENWGYTWWETIPKCYSKDAYIVCYNESDSEFRYDDQILIFDKNFSLVRHISADEILEAGICECGNLIGENPDLFVTQTLFNDDDAFEYFTVDEKEVIVGEGEQEYSHTVHTCLKVMSDNGTELARITFDKFICRLDPTIIRIEDNNYLVLSCTYFDSSHPWDGGESFQKLYLIDKNPSGQDAIREVEMPEGLKAFPALARKNQSVSIELGENAGGRLLVTSANGSVARQLPVKQGQTSVQLNTRGLASGVYVVSTVNASGKQENCKIVIK